MRKSIKRLMMLLMALVVLVTSQVPSVLAADFPANPLTKAGYYLDFQDEFDGQTLDSTKWLDQYLPHWTNDVNKAKARYSMRDGKLVLRLDSTDTPWSPLDGTVVVSGITTFNKNWLHNFSGSNYIYDRPSNSFNGYTTKYGYFEMRTKKAIGGGGGHQAWWMVGCQDDASNWSNSKQTAEFDIIETQYYATQNWRICSYGWNDPSFSNMWISYNDPVPSGSPTTEYHIYAMEWDPWQLRFYYDNQLYKVINDSPDYRMTTILSMYVGAGFSGNQPTSNVWPKEWYIDYIRVWKPIDGYTTPPTPSYYRIKNYNTGEYMHIDNNTGKVELSKTIPSSNMNSQWVIEDYNGYKRIQNRQTGQYLHIENNQSYVQYGSVGTDWWSSQWTMENNTGYVRFKNRWKGTYIHNESKLGYTQVGSVQSGWWSARWILEPVN